MISRVDWSYIIYEIPAAGPYRIKKRPPGSTLPTYPAPDGQGTVYPNKDEWHQTALASLPWPNKTTNKNDTYDFGFWTLIAKNSKGNVVFRQAPSNQGQFVTISHPDAMGQPVDRWTVTAKAYYFLHYPTGSGNEALYIDAFDIDAFDFIADDFVVVTPDPSGKLTSEANDGMINTSTEITQGNPITIAANYRISRVPWFFGPIKGLKFDTWLPIDSLMHAADPNNPPVIGAPDPWDVVVNIGDDVFATAFYVEGHWEGLQWPIIAPWPLHPIDPETPLLKEFMAALVLVDMANKVSPELKSNVLELALKQVSIATNAINKQIENLKSGR